MSNVILYGPQDKSRCGYCKSNGSSSYGFRCERMLVDDYESLMVKGWRRCGGYYYKPNLALSCCKLNTIRLNVYDYHMNKKQVKVDRKFTSYLEGKQSAKKFLSKAQKRQINKQILRVPSELENILKDSIITICDEKLGIDYDQKFLAIQKNDTQRSRQRGTYSVSSIKIISSHLKKLHSERSEQELTTLLIERLQVGLENSPWSIRSSENGFIQLDEMPSESDLTNRSEQEDMSVDSTKHDFQFVVVSDDFTSEAYELYRKYQINIHRDAPSSITPQSYTRFLCNSSLVQRSDDQMAYGSFHLEYRIDGKLIGVSVVDILPSGLSSVYFFYDTDYKFLSLGTLSAIKEIQFIKSKNSVSFQYYYMGFYIESCKKMRYKGDFQPSELLCPTSYQWVPLDDILPYKQDHKFLNFKLYSDKTRDLSDDPDMSFYDIASIENFLDRVKLNQKGQIYKLRQRETVFGILEDALPYFGKKMMTILTFCL